MSAPCRDDRVNGTAHGQPSPPPSGAQPVVTFLAGNGHPGTGLLYKLLCLHPQVAFISHLENTWPWLPVTVTGRLRLQRYSSKLRYWFREHEPVTPGRRALARQLMPADGQAVYARYGLVASRSWQHPPERVAQGLRMHLQRLQESTGTSLVLCDCGPADVHLPALAEMFPHGTCLEVAGSRHGRAFVPARLHTVCYEALVAEPIEQMRRVLTFVGLERRLDYEWALKTLKLDRPFAGAAFERRHAARRDLAENEPPAPSRYAS